MDKIIEQSMKDLANIIVGNNSNSKLLIPQYAGSQDGKERFSEQELEFLLVENIVKSNNYFYSVETPTKFFYKISKAPKPEMSETHQQGDGFESGNIDVSVYGNSSISSLCSNIELKCNNKQEGLGKDFLRLSYEFGTGNNYFVHYVVNKSSEWKTKTFPSLIEKYIEATNDVINENKNHPRTPIYLSKVIVYLMFVDTNAKDKLILKFTLDNVKNVNTPVPIFNPQNLPNGFTIVF